MDGLVRRVVSGADVARVLRSENRGARVFRNLLALASVLLLSLGSAQTSTNIDNAIGAFQTEGVRLIGVVSAAGLAVIAASVLMVLGWAMLRKVSGGK